MAENKSSPMLIILAGVLLALVLGLGFVLLSDPAKQESIGNNAVEKAEDVENRTSDAMRPVPSKNIVELAQDQADLSTLVEALIAGDLVSALSDTSRSFTVFAPLNSAFADVPSTVDELLKPENKDSLLNVLTYHVVPTVAFSFDLVDGQELTALNGSVLKVRVTDDGVFINGAKVVLVDVEATNGVVHVIDKVLVP